MHVTTFDDGRITVGTKFGPGDHIVTDWYTRAPEEIIIRSVSVCDTRVFYTYIAAEGDVKRIPAYDIDNAYYLVTKPKILSHVNVYLNGYIGTSCVSRAVADNTVSGNVPRVAVITVDETGKVEVEDLR